MIPIRLEIQNFLAYRSPQPIVLEGIHLACLTGMNGAGKSSLLDAMTWALWGKARTRRDNDLIHLNTTEMMVQLDFLHEGQTYRIIRRRSKRGLSGSGRLDLFIYDDKQQIVEIREGSTNATQDRINNLLRMDYDTFVHSSFLQQGQADSFTTQQPAKRKQTLSNILGLEAWAGYEEKAKTLAEHYKSQAKALDLRIQEIIEQLATEPAKRRDLAEADEAFAALQAAYDAAYTLLNEVADAPIKRDAAKKNLSDAEARQKRHQSDMDSLLKDMETAAKKIAEYQAVLENRTDIEAGYQTLKTAREASEELSQKLSDLRDIETQRSTLNETLSGARGKLQSEVKSLTKQIERLQKQVDGVDDEAVTTIKTQIVDLEAKSAERDSLQGQVNALNEENAECRATNATLKTTMDELKERIDTLSNVEGAACPLCGQALTEDHRKELLAELQTEGTTQGDTFRANVDRMKAIKGEQKQLNAQFETLSNAIAEIPRLQKRLGELQSQSESAQVARAELETVQARLAEITTELENESFAGDVRTQLAEVEAQIASIGYSDDDYKGNRATLKKFQEYEDLYNRLSRAEESLEPLLDSHKRDADRKQRLNTIMAEIGGEITALEVEVEQQKQRVVLRDARQAEVMRLTTDKEMANNRVVSARQALDAINTIRQRKQEYEIKRTELAEQQAMYTELRTAFGKNGVPAMIIETAIPELEITTNELLGRMTDGRMSVSFSTQREKVTGGLSETLDITIRDELGARGYELYSGGEAFRINFAIRVALSKMLARRAGAHLETLFVDEGFGTQDADGRSKLVEAINAVKDEFELILVITHIDELKDAFPVHINVEKTASGSMVEVR